MEAGNGNEALSVAREHSKGSIDLLLTDLVMPLMGGMELAGRLKDVHPAARVLYTSGYTDDTVIQTGVMQSGGGFMQKPFTPAVLARKVREVLDG
jgi:YesN/AraC family two-component response regulator